MEDTDSWVIEHRIKDLLVFNFTEIKGIDSCDKCKCYCCQMKSKYWEDRKCRTKKDIEWHCPLAHGFKYYIDISAYDMAKEIGYYNEDGKLMTEEEFIKAYRFWNYHPNLYK